MSRAILPGTKVRTSKQKAIVGPRSQRDTATNADESTQERRSEPNRPPQPSETAPEIDHRPVADAGVSVRLVTVGSERALLELRCSCGKATLVWLTTGPQETTQQGQQASARPTENDGEQG